MCESPIKIKDPNKESEYIEVPCRKCILCRRKRCRSWAIRMFHESQYHKKMCMLTLTFRPKFLLTPKVKKLVKWKQHRKPDGTTERKKIEYETMINPSYITDVKKTGWIVTLFMKKLRKWAQKRGQFISYFAVGEHGTQNTHRAHWHIIIFGLDKSDLQCVSLGENKKKKEILFSRIIDEIWSYDKVKCGKHTVSDVTTSTIKYVANYTMKKMYKNQKKGKQYPTIMRFSNQNKIGTKWARKYHKELRKGYLEDNEKNRYPIPEQYINELKRYQNSIFDESMQYTLRELERIKEETINKMLKNGLLSKQEQWKKARRLEFKYKQIERDVI